METLEDDARELSVRLADAERAWGEANDLVRAAQHDAERKLQVVRAIREQWLRACERAAKGAKLEGFGGRMAPFVGRARASMRKIEACAEYMRRRGAMDGGEDPNSKFQVPIINREVA